MFPFNCQHNRITLLTKSRKGSLGGFLRFSARREPWQVFATERVNETKDETDGLQWALLLTHGQSAWNIVFLSHISYLNGLVFLGKI